MEDIQCSTRLISYTINMDSPLAECLRCVCYVRRAHVTIVSNNHTPPMPTILDHFYTCVPAIWTAYQQAVCAVMTGTRVRAFNNNHARSNWMYPGHDVQPKNTTRSVR